MEGKNLRNLVISAILLVFSVTFVVGTVKIVRRGGRLVEVQKELVALQKQRERLEKEERFRNSPEFIEEEARNKLNMVKPGEEVYIRPKILGDNLLGVSDTSDVHDRRQPSSQGFISSIVARITGLFDKIKDMLVLFQS